MTSPRPARTTALTSATAAAALPGEFFEAGLGVAGAMTGAEDRRVAERAAVAAVAALATGDRSTGHESCGEPTP
jgi:hypothetical protein